MVVSPDFASHDFFFPFFFGFADPSYFVPTLYGVYAWLSFLRLCLMQHLSNHVYMRNRKALWKGLYRHLTS